MNAGSIPKLTPLSYRSPRGCPILSLSCRRSKITSVITSIPVRLGEASMERFAPEHSAGKSKVLAAAEAHHRPCATSAPPTTRVQGTTSDACC